MTTVSLREAIDMGLKHHMAGRLAEAESIYVQIIHAHPNQADPIHLLGVIALQRGQFGSAIELINRAVDLSPYDARFHCNLGQAYAGCGLIEDAINAHKRALSISPELPEALNNLGNAFQQVGRFDEAIQMYQRALRQRPDFLEVHNNLGNAHRGLGDHPKAIEWYEKALKLMPDYPDALSNLASTLSDMGQQDQALAAVQKAVALRPEAAEFQNNLCSILRRRKEISRAIEAGRRSVELRPDYVQAHCSLGAALLDNGQVEAAIESFNQAIAIQPEFAEAYSNLGNAYRAKEEPERAIEAYRKAIELKPQYADAHANLAKLLHTLDRYEEAIDSCRRAMELRPGFADALSDLGTSLANTGKIQEAVECYRQALAAEPEDAIIHYNLGLTHLLNGDYRAGWAECEWRWFAPELDSPYPQMPTPRWEGNDLNGRHILIFAEQGFGDTIQFARFIPMVARRGGPVTFVCQPELLRLMRNLEGVTNLSSTSDRLVAHDTHYALLSLPVVFDTTVETIPNPGGYLRPDAELLQKWRERLAEHAGSFKVGLVWAGRRHPDPKRAIPPELLAPLADVPGVRYFSLQKSELTGSAPPPPGIELIDYMSDMTDFADTAAFIDNLDLVISVDTAVAHLAGAIGKPVWILLPFLPDWRWMLGRDDSPWYSSARLFRQPARKDWQTPIDKLVRELRQAAGGRQ